MKNVFDENREIMDIGENKSDIESMKGGNGIVELLVVSSVSVVVVETL